MQHDVYVVPVIRAWSAQWHCKILGKQVEHALTNWSQWKFKIQMEECCPSGRKHIMAI